MSLPRFPSQIAQEQGHILQKLEGPLGFCFLSLLAALFGVEDDILNTQIHMCCCLQIKKFTAQNLISLV